MTVASAIQDYLVIYDSVSAIQDCLVIYDSGQCYTGLPGDI